MDANSIKSVIGENDLLSLLTDLGAEPIPQGNNIVCKTVCHGGHKHKLVYYSDSKKFKCFTDNCGGFDIYGLIGKVLELDFYESFIYLCNKLGISYKYDSSQIDERVDVSYFKKFKKQKYTINLSTLDENILRTYDDLYHEEWINDGISIRSMKKFNIKFSILDNQIIIPHYNEFGQLIGVRARNLNKDLVEDGKKYMPVFRKGEFLKHPTGAALYGLDKNIENIKKIKKIILFESEKSVLQLDTFLPSLSIGVCLSGSSLTPYQIEILKTLDIDEVIVGLDKEYDEIGSQEEKFYAQKIQAVFGDKLIPYFKVSVLWDQKNLLDKKDSPTDKGIEVFDQLLKTRIFL